MIGGSFTVAELGLSMLFPRDIDLTRVLTAWFGITTSPFLCHARANVDVSRVSDVTQDLDRYEPNGRY